MDLWMDYSTHSITVSVEFTCAELHSNGARVQQLLLLWVSSSWCNVQEKSGMQGKANAYNDRVG
jgi:hypothetical protein